MKTKINVKELINDIIAMFLGSFVYSVAVNTFTLPNYIVPGGVIGIATVVHKFTEWPVGVMSLLFTIPLFLAALRILGIKSTLKILGASAVFFLMTDITAPFLPHYTENMLVAAIFGGVIGGLGLGIMIVRGITTGGTDLLAQIIVHFFHAFSYGMTLAIVDAIIVVAAAIVFQDMNSMLYAAITIYITGIVIDKISNGFDSAKLLQIITEKPKELSEQIMTRMNRGVTLIKSQGAYTGKDRDMVFIVVKRIELQRLKRMVKELDPAAFIIIGDVSEVLGEGFKEENAN
ncbi:MAG: YitT family protein [Clostridia bacterium]|nr:YitT family protein [Clostridia bacterium]